MTTGVNADDVCLEVCDNDPDDRTTGRVGDALWN